MKVVVLQSTKQGDIVENVGKIHGLAEVFFSYSFVLWKNSDGGTPEYCN